MLTIRMLMLAGLSVLALLGSTIAERPALPEHAVPANAASLLSVDRIAALDAAIEEIRERFGVPGLAVGIVEQGSPAYARGFGVRDVRTGAPVTPHTLFRAASISKTFTATAVLQLAEQGRLAIDDPLERHLSAFASSGITLTHLLTHSAGFEDWRRASGANDDAAVASYVEEISRHDLAYAPGSGWEYSDTAFNVLGAVIEAVSGQTYPDYLRDHVLAPAGMTDSTFYPPDPTAEIAWPHPGEIFIHRASSRPWDRVSLPSSGLETSVTDLMRWAVVNLNRDPSLLSPASYEALFRYRIDTRWHGIAMGLGWQLERRDDHWLPRHAGGERGFRALLTLYPEVRRAIVILSNGETTPRWEIRRVVEATLAGQAAALPEPSAVRRFRWVWVSGLAALVLLVIVAAARRRLRASRIRAPLQ